VIASELMEAGRAIAGGYVTPDRTMTIASTSRSYLVVEKMAMADGRYDQQRLLQAVENNSQKTLLLDFEAIARGSGAMIKAVDANLRGFRAGFAAARDGSRLRSDPLKRHQAPSASLADLESEIERMPEPARAFMTEGVRRLAAYQDLAYARRYLDRLAPIRDADANADAEGRLLAQTARHLAVRMSYEDVIRVAQAKIDPARFARIAGELDVKPDQTFTVTEFLKPGVDEFCSILPPWLAGRILALAERHAALGRAHCGMAVNTASVFARLGSQVNGHFRVILY
jgi:indolepyruvate ferredoxin oxidoreductase beta subunit